MSILVSAAILLQGDRVLLTRRKAGSHLAGLWEFPGGKVEVDEDPRDALVRELREELGIEASAGEIVEVTFHRYPERAVLLLFFEARLLPGSPPPMPIDAAEVAWCGLDELDARTFPPADIAVLERVRRRLGGG